MSKKDNEVNIPDEVLMEKIYLIRGQKVMLDRDLAALYGVETRRLKEQVRRNIGRFPANFMFEMTHEELADWVSQFATSNRETKGMRVLPFVFTEHGILMLANVLKSEQAIQMSIRIIELFVKLREMLLTHKDILLKLEQLEKKMTGHDGDIQVIFGYLKQFIKEQEQPRKEIGFKKER